jgi:hypothetical protein
MLLCSATSGSCRDRTSAIWSTYPMRASAMAGTCTGCHSKIGSRDVTVSPFIGNTRNGGSDDCVLKRAHCRSTRTIPPGPASVTHPSYSPSGSRPVRATICWTSRFQSARPPNVEDPVKTTASRAGMVCGSVVPRSNTWPLRVSE